MIPPVGDSIYCLLHSFMGFPDSSIGKESACNAGDLGLIPGEWIGCPVQYSCVFPVAQLVKNLPVMRETWV